MPQVGRRPNFSREFKREIVEKTMQPGASISRIALEHGLNTNMLFKWRSRYRATQRALTAPETQEPAMLPVIIADSSQPVTPEGGDSNVIELEFAPARMVVRGDVNSTVLRVILQSLTR